MKGLLLFLLVALCSFQEPKTDSVRVIYDAYGNKTVNKYLSNKPKPVVKKKANGSNYYRKAE